MVRIVGKTLAYTSIRFMDGKGELVARGSHTKFSGPILISCL